MVQLASSAQPRTNSGTPRDRYDQAEPLSRENADFAESQVKDFRENTEPTIREYLKNNIGANVDKKLESRYNDYTFTGALGSLAYSAPAMVASAAGGGAGLGAMYAQTFDNAIESINSTEEGRKLDEGTKSLFGASVASVGASLEKFGLDKIFKSESGLVSDLLTKYAIKKLSANGTKKVTGDALASFLDKEVINLSNKYIQKGAKALDGALVEYGTEFLQEGDTQLSELLTNKLTGKPVFDTSSLDNWKGFIERANKAGVSGMIGGGLLGGFASMVGGNGAKVKQNEATIAEIDKNLANEALPETSRQVLMQKKLSLQNENQEVADKIDAHYEKLNPKQKEEVNTIAEDKIKLEQAIADPNVSAEVKTELENQSKELDKQLSEITPLAREKEYLDKSIQEEKQQIKDETSKTKVGRLLDKIIGSAPDDSRLKNLESDKRLLEENPIEFIKKRKEEYTNFKNKEGEQAEQSVLEYFDDAIYKVKEIQAKIKPSNEVTIKEEVITPKDEVKSAERVKEPELTVITSDNNIASVNKKIKAITSEFTEKNNGIELSEEQLFDINKKASDSYIKDKDLWIDNLDDLGEYAKQGTENKVWIDKKNKVVYKANNLYNSEGLLSNYMQSIKVHNKLFPDSNYELVGFTDTDNGKARQPIASPVVRQKFYGDGVPASPTEISDMMDSLGFKKIGDGKYDNGEYTVSDLHPRNVLKVGDKLVVIDDTIAKNKNATPKMGDTQNTPKEKAVEKTVDEAKDFAISEVKRGAINWDGDRFTPRPELGLEWKDIRKGQQDLLDGKDTPASKRLVEAINKAKENGGYDYVQGSGKMTSKTFVPLNEKVELSKDELADMTKNEDNLATQYDEWFDSLDESEKQEELNSIEYGNESKDSETTVNKEPKGKEDVSDTEDSKAERKDVKPTIEKRVSDIEKELGVKMIDLVWAPTGQNLGDLMEGKNIPPSSIKPSRIEAYDLGKNYYAIGYDNVDVNNEMTFRLFNKASNRFITTISKTKSGEWTDVTPVYAEKMLDLLDKEFGGKLKASDIVEVSNKIKPLFEGKPTVSEKLGEIEAKRQAIKDRIAEKFKAQRGNLSSGFDPSLLKDFIELGSTYIEEGVVKASDFIKRFREDYKSMGFEDELTDEQITEQIFDKVSKEQVKEEPKPQSDFDKLATKSLPKRETRETKSNVEDVTGDVLTTDMKEFEGVDFKQSLIHGDNVVQQAKLEFGDSYVSDLLDYVEGAKMPFENKAVLLVSLENDLRKQLLADPKNVRLRKQVDAVTKASIEHLRSGATAAAVGQFRWAARANYETELAAASIFTPKEREQRAKVEGAVYSSSEDVQSEYEEREARLDEIIDEGVEKRINELYEALPSNRKIRADKAIAALDKIQKRLRAKTYDASIGLPIAIVDAGISTIKAAIKAGVSVVDAIELGINKIKSEYGKKWDKEGDFRKDMLAGFKTEGVNVKEGVNNSLKKELIDAGYGKEINVKTKNGKEKRNILDWKKLTGIEGSFENMRDNLDKSLKGKGYSEAEISEFQKQLEDEYNDIHADIIEKSINELNRRNTPKDVDTKTLARRLAELYNLGLYDKDVDTYSNILNNALGVTPASQEAFNEIRDFNKSLARLLETKDANGNNLSDVALATAETQIKNRIKRVIEKVQFAEGNGLFKASVILKNLFSAMQRMMLVKLSQLVENPFSGKLNDLQVKLQDAFKKGKWDTKELAQQRKMLANAIYQDVTVRRGDEYGGVGNPFTSKNTIEDFVNSLPEKVFGKNFFGTLGNGITALLSGRLYLDAADSYFKIKRTEKEFTHNLLRVLTDKSNPNGAMSQEEALHYVNEALTGQSFEDARKLAREIIEDINNNAGKEILRTNESNVTRLANDLVKDALVNGERLTAKQVEQSFKAGYKTAGKSMGHEANNLLSKLVGLLNQHIQTELNEALKKKQWSAAAILNLSSILSKNIIFPFVGGGTNWTVIGLQKMGLPTEWINPNVGFSERPIDLSTKDGAKELEKTLAANATRDRQRGRMVTGTLTAAAMLLALKGSGSDDEYLKWLRKHPEARKILNKVMPTWLTLYLARDNKNSEFIKALFESMGSRKDYDAVKIEKASKDFYKGVADKDEKAWKRAWGTIGELTGRRFTVPYLSTISNYGVTNEKLRKEFMGTPDKKQYKPSKSFVSGFYRDGLIDYLGLRPEDGKKDK